MATIPLSIIAGYGITTSLVRWRVTVTQTSVGFATTPNSNLSTGLYDNETVVVSTSIPSFSAGLHIAVNNETSTGTTVSYTPSGKLTVTVRVDGVYLSNTNQGLDNLVFESTPKTVSNGSSFQLSVLFNVPGYYSLYISLN